MKSIELNIEKALGTVSKSCTKVRVKEMTF